MSASLSARAQRSLALGSPLSDKFAQLFANQYCPEKNPTGLVNVGVAENTLMLNELDDFYHSKFRLEELDYSYGSAMHGSKRLFEALCQFFNDSFDPVVPVEEQHLICGAGLAAVLDQLTYAFCDEGDGVLICKPLYNGFKNAIESRCLAKAIGVEVPFDEITSPGSLAYFERKINELRANGTPVKAIILCNPHNPLGILYPRESIVAYCAFAEKHDLHLIVDEIYALSVYDTQSSPNFTSILSIDAQKEAGCDPSRVHMVYGASKDFCSNGFRLGFFVSQHNAVIRKALRNLAIFMKVSSPSDQLFASLIRDQPFMENFVKTNQDKLGKSYEFVTNWCRKHKISYCPATAGHFVFIDLNRFAKKCVCDGDMQPNTINSDNRARATAEQEAKLLVQMLDGGIYIGPGAAYECSQPGWFRLTHSIKRPLMELALERLEFILGLKDSSEISTPDGAVTPAKDSLANEMTSKGAEPKDVAEVIRQMAACGFCC